MQGLEIPLDVQRQRLARTQDAQTRLAGHMKGVNRVGDGLKAKSGTVWWPVQQAVAVRPSLVVYLRDTHDQLQLLLREVDARLA